MTQIYTSVSSESMFPSTPTLQFRPGIDTCPQDGTKLKVLKTRVKTLVSMDIGPFNAQETILQCSVDRSIYFCEEVQALAPEKSKFCYDVIVYVGRALFLHSRNTREIKEELARRKICISNRGINYIGKKFIIYLAIAHRESQSQLDEILTKNGGYILHLDGTCEGDSPHLFTGLDEISKIILDNIKIPSENSADLIPFLRRMKKQYGTPKAIVADMGKGIHLAVAVVFPDISIFICHFHFLRDIGKDLLGNSYAIIRNKLKDKKIRRHLRDTIKLFKKIIPINEAIIQRLITYTKSGDIDSIFKQEMSAVSIYAMMLWALDYHNESNGYGFPFDRPHFEFYQRLKIVHSLVRNVIFSDVQSNVRLNNSLYKLFRSLNGVITDKSMIQAVTEMKEQITVFDKLRVALRIARQDGKNGLNDNGKDADIKTIKEKMTTFRNWLVTNTCYSKDTKYQAMIKQIDKYWDKLFADPIEMETSDGPVMVQPQRTNNILERFFRDLKKGYRKRNGQVTLNKILKTILSDAPLVKNLENQEYLKIILKGTNNLEERFAQIDKKEVASAFELSEKNIDKISKSLKSVIRTPDLPMLLNSLFDDKITKTNRPLPA